MLLTSTGNIVRRWKENFKDLLNPTDMPALEEIELDDSPFIRALKYSKNCSVGVDEILPEVLKALDVVGLSWLTSLFNIAWRSATVPLDWLTGRFRGNHTPKLP